MIHRRELLDLSFYESSAFTGSCGSMCYRIAMVNENGGKLLDACSWLGPYAYPQTDPSRMTHHRADFSEEGMEELTCWLNGQVNKYPDQMPGILDVDPYQPPAQNEDEN